MTADKVAVAKAKRPVVYVVTSPALRSRPAWPKVRAAVKTKAKGAKLAECPDIFIDHADYAACWEKKLAELDGAIVVPFNRGAHQWIGPAAQREADFLTGIGKPVFLLAPDGLIRWSQVQSAHPDSHPPAQPDDEQTGSGQESSGWPLCTKRPPKQPVVQI